MSADAYDSRSGLPLGLWWDEAILPPRLLALYIRGHRRYRLCQHVAKTRVRIY